VARALIVGCGCRGRELGRMLREEVAEEELEKLRRRRRSEAT
jgi:hypothetical protein